MRTSLLAVVVILVVAGCSSGPAPTDPPTTTARETASQTPLPTTSVETPASTPTAASSTPSPTSTASPTPSPTPTPTPTPTPVPPENPWSADPIIVAIDDPIPDQDVRPSVEAAIAYWNGNIEKYSDFHGRFVLRPNASNPDILVRFTRQVICDGTEEAIGCAPYYDRVGAVTDPPTEIEIEAGYSRSNTTRTVKHEFGHVLGIEHGSDPMPLMRSSHDVTYQSVTDAHNRSNPWYTDNLTVFLEAKGDWYDTDRQRYKEQLDHAVTYYDDGADGHVPANVSFAWTRNRTAAEIVFAFPDDPPCGEAGESLSCYSQFGHNLDTDDAFEYHVNATISFTDIPEDRVAWHAGYWLGFAMGAANVSDLPPPFDEPEEDPREDWWDE